MKLVFIPEPQQITVDTRSVDLPLKGIIGIADSSLFGVAEEIQPLFSRFDIGIIVPHASTFINVSIRDNVRNSGYRLKINKAGVFVEAASVAMAFHAVQTLRQISVQSPPGKLPVLTINDWPDFQDRGLYYDVCRGRVPKLERLFEMVDLLGQYKINHFQLYIEHTFKFRGHPDIGKGASPLTAEDILSLDAYCKEKHIELVPSFASFGHMATVLKHKQYHHLAEDMGVSNYQDPNTKGSSMTLRPAWSLAPANPESYDFLDELFSEFLPLFSSEQFNICCDETYDLGLGQSYEMCKKKGRGRLYLDHILKVKEIAANYGKRVMFWGDVIRKYPELIKDIPDDVAVLDWGYEHDHPFGRISDFKKVGIPFYGCPGTSSWCSLFPRLSKAMDNISGFALAAKRNGARGLLNTDWGDGGHFNFMEYSWHGYMFGAEQSWNVKADRKSFTNRFVRLFLNSSDESLVNAIDELGNISLILVEPYYGSVWPHILFAAPSDPLWNMGDSRDMLLSVNGVITKQPGCLDSKLGKDVLVRLDLVRQSFVKAQKQKGVDPSNVLSYWIFAVDTFTVAARKLAVFGAGGKDTKVARKSLKKDLVLLMKRFEKLWMARNRRSEIRITLKRYSKAIESL